jgi:adenylate kinase family enzyme
MPLDKIQRVVVLGPGASGKSTLARRLGEITGIPVIELDKIFWQPGLRALPPDHWVRLQQETIAQEQWILDGDLGPYDAVEVRLHAADTVIFLDFALLRCAWRALLRSPERLDFWLWLMQYRLKHRRLLLNAIRSHAPHAKLFVLRDPKSVQRFLASQQFLFRIRSEAHE